MIRRQEIGMRLSIESLEQGGRGMSNNKKQAIIIYVMFISLSNVFTSLASTRVGVWRLIRKLQGMHN